MGDILVITEHLKDEFQDITFEMLGKAKELTGISGGQCVAVTFGSMHGKADELGTADSVISIGGSDDYNPESYAAAVQSLIREKSPSLIMVGFTSMGMDIASSVATALDIPAVSYCANINVSGSQFSCTSSMYGGKMNVVTHVEGPVLAMVLAGSYNAETGRVSGSPDVESFPADFGSGNVRFKQLIEPEDVSVLGLPDPSEICNNLSSVEQKKFRTNEALHPYRKAGHPDYIKVMFIFPDHKVADLKIPGEIMWVFYEKDFAPGRYLGQLRNNAHCCSLKEGDQVEFSHVEIDGQFFPRSWSALPLLN